MYGLIKIGDIIELDNGQTGYIQKTKPASVLIVRRNGAGWMSHWIARQRVKKIIGETYLCSVCGMVPTICSKETPEGGILPEQLVFIQCARCHAQYTEYVENQ